jgi:hypothetical protein
VLSVFATVLVMQTWRVDAAPGDTDSTFVPVTPCRLFDYRLSELPAGGKKTPLAARSPATQQVTGTVGNCIIPDTGVVAVAMNVTVVNGTAQSNLRLYPADTAEPLVSNMNWKAGDSVTAKKVDVKVSPTGQIKLANFNGTVNVSGDIVGYYTNSTLKELAAGLAASDAKLAATDAKLVALEIAQPFAVSNYMENEKLLTTTPARIVNVTVTAPVDGQVTLNYSTLIDNLDVGVVSMCSPHRSTEIPADLTPEDEGSDSGRSQRPALAMRAVSPAHPPSTYQQAKGSPTPSHVRNEAGMELLTVEQRPQYSRRHPDRPSRHLVAPSPECRVLFESRRLLNQPEEIRTTPFRGKA